MRNPHRLRMSTVSIRSVAALGSCPFPPSVLTSAPPRPFGFVAPQVSSELRATVQRLYVDTLRRMDGALTNICAEFDPDKYTKVVRGGGGRARE